jgi:methylaspartate ammonia-lyase
MFSNTFNASTHDYQLSIAELRAAGLTRDAWAMEALLEKVADLEADLEGRVDADVRKEAIQNMAIAITDLERAEKGIREVRDEFNDVGDFTRFENMDSVLTSLQEATELIGSAKEELTNDD